MHENEAYKVFLDQLHKEEIVPENSEERESLKNEEARLCERLDRVKQERAKTLRETQTLIQQEKEIEVLEIKYWEGFNDFQGKIIELECERDAAKMQIDHVYKQYEILKRANVYNDAFHIWHDGHFGTINTFRLGRLPNIPVSWDEVNVAWGQATLLLYIMAKRLDFKFKSHRLVPMGSSSKIVKLEDGSQYELYGSNEYALVKYFSYRRFDTAMAAFLTCLKELGDYAEREDRTFRLPYRIDKEKIGGLSIHIQVNEESWTKALKYMLSDMKWLLAWIARRPVSQRFSSKRVGSNV